MEWKQADKIGGCSRLTCQYPSLAYSKRTTCLRHLVATRYHQYHRVKKKGGEGVRTDTRERSTSAVRSSRSCPGARSSHRVTSVMNVKDAPSAGRPAVVASFSTCEGAHLSSALASQWRKGTHTRMHNPCFCAAARRRRMNIVISA